MTQVSKDTTETWVRLVRAYRAASSQIEQALTRAAYPPLAWYDVLWELEGRPNGLRVFELEQSLLLPQYNVSRLVDRLEQERLISKMTDRNDRRGRVLKITPKGAKLRLDMWPTYADALNAAIGQRLNPNELKRLSKMLGAVVG